MSESVIPAVLLRALSEYKFVGHPLRRIAGRTDYVCVELTFHKTLPTLPIYKKRAESRRQPAPLLASGLATAARRPPDQQPTPARRPTPCVKEETPPPPPLAQTLPDTPRSTHFKIHHYTLPQAEDSHHRASIDHH